jgi:hypothetical protein
MSTSLAKSSRVLTGAKRLHSMAKPRSAMRGEAGVTLVSYSVSRSHAIGKRSGFVAGERIHMMS